jgi:hypothetical protein
VNILAAGRPLGKRIQKAIKPHGDKNQAAHRQPGNPSNMFFLYSLDCHGLKDRAPQEDCAKYTKGRDYYRSAIISQSELS